MLIQLSSGQGPKECERACYLYYRELMKEFSLKVISISHETNQCCQSVVLYSENDISFLEGTMQWISLSPFRPHHKRKNWFVDVSILQEELDMENEQNIRYEVLRSSGKGGQNVNKVSTAIRAIHIPTGISVISMDQRSQYHNKKIAYLRLLKKVEENISSKNSQIQYDNWNEKHQLIRGQPNRIYQGEKMKRIK